MTKNRYQLDRWDELLDVDTSVDPFESTDFVTEMLAGQWVHFDENFPVMGAENETLRYNATNDVVTSAALLNDDTDIFLGDSLLLGGITKDQSNTVFSNEFRGDSAIGPIQFSDKSQESLLEFRTGGDVALISRTTGGNTVSLIGVRSS